MGRADRNATIAYVVLIAATAWSFWAAEHLAVRIVAVAAIMATAAVKILIVLKQFMELGHTPLAFRVYFHAWAIGCAAMILCASWIAAR